MQVEHWEKDLFFLGNCLNIQFLRRQLKILNIRVEFDFSPQTTSNF